MHEIAKQTKRKKKKNDKKDKKKHHQREKETTKSMLHTLSWKSRQNGMNKFTNSLHMFRFVSVEEEMTHNKKRKPSWERRDKHTKAGVYKLIHDQMMGPTHDVYYALCLCVPRTHPKRHSISILSIFLNSLLCFSSSLFFRSRSPIKEMFIFATISREFYCFLFFFLVVAVVCSPTPSTNSWQQ